MSEAKPAVEKSEATEVVLRSRVPGWLIKAVMIFAARERMRYLLTCIKVEHTKKSVLTGKEAIRVVATDGRALMVVDLAIDTQRESKPQSIAPFPAIYLDRKDVIALRPIDMLEVMPDGAIRILQQVGNSKEPEYKHRYDLRTNHEGAYPRYEDIVEGVKGNGDLAGVFASPEILEKAVRVNKEVLRRTSDGVGGVKWIGTGKQSIPFASIVQKPWRAQYDDRGRDYVNHNVEAVSVIMPVSE